MNYLSKIVYNNFIKNYNLDGLTSFDQKTIICINDNDDTWFEPANYDDGVIPYDGNVVPPDNPTSSSYDRGITVPPEKRKGIWQLTVVNGKIKLSYLKDWPASTKIFVKEGREYGHIYVFKDTQQKIFKVPNITAPNDTLFYQDGIDPNVYGVLIICIGISVAVLRFVTTDSLEDR